MKKIFVSQYLGLILTIFLFTAICFTVILNIFNPDFYALFIVIYLILLVMTISAVKTGFCSFVILTEKGVRHRNTFYSWEDVCISMYVPGGLQRISYKLVFDNKFYSTEEKESAGKNSFFIVPTVKRLKELFKFYNKQVKIMSKCASGEHILKEVESHNNIY